MPKEHIIIGMKNTSILINDNETIFGFGTKDLKDGSKTRDEPNVLTFADVRDHARQDSLWKEIVDLIDAHCPDLIINTN